MNMKKVFAICTLLLALGLLFTACGGEEDTPNSPTGNNPATSPVPNNGDEPCPDEGLEASLPPEGAITNGFYLAIGGGQIFLNQDIIAVIDLLGEAGHVIQTPSCAFDGYDRQFFYANVIIDTYPVGDRDFVRIIRFRNDGITTTNGIRAGQSTWDDVLAAYGNNYTQNFGHFTFTQAGTTLTFEIDEEDGSVTNIFYALVE